MTYTDVLEKLSNIQTNNDSSTFLELSFPYLDHYKEFNAAIVLTAKKGSSSIKFDFVDDDESDSSQLTFEEYKSKRRRVYPPSLTGNAVCNMYDFPFYLAARGFSIKITDSQKQHGYKSKAYLIEWT